MIHTLIGLDFLVLSTAPVFISLSCLRHVSSHVFKVLFRRFISCSSFSLLYPQHVSSLSYLHLFCMSSSRVVTYLQDTLSAFLWFFSLLSVLSSARDFSLYFHSVTFKAVTNMDIKVFTFSKVGLFVLLCNRVYTNVGLKNCNACGFQ